MSVEARRRKGLGRGLSALIPGAPAAAENPAAPARDVSIDDVEPNPWQPRRVFADDALAELAASIREQGILQPLVVRPRGERYQLLAGERRFRAARLAGLERVPIEIRDVDDRGALEVALVENLQREDLSPLEEAEGYARLGREFGLTQEAVAERVGKSRPAVTNALRLLQLPEEVRREVDVGRLSAGHARALLGVPSEAARVSLARRAIAEGWSVRQVEEHVRGTGARKPRGGRPAKTRDVHVADLERRLERALATRVRVEPRGKGGRIVVEYFSEAELDGLLRRLLADGRS